MAHLSTADFQPLRIAVLTVSDTRNLETDTSGQALITALQDAGHRLAERALAGISNGTLVCCLPGSPNACRTAWEKILLGQLDARTRPCNFVPHLKRLDEQPATCCGSRS